MLFRGDTVRYKEITSHVSLVVHADFSPCIMDPSAAVCAEKNRSNYSWIPLKETKRRAFRCVHWKRTKKAVGTICRPKEEGPNIVITFDVYLLVQHTRNIPVFCFTCNIKTDICLLSTSEIQNNKNVSCTTTKKSRNPKNCHTYTNKPVVWTSTTLSNSSWCASVCLEVHNRCRINAKWDNKIGVTETNVYTQNIGVSS